MSKSLIVVCMVMGVLAQSERATAQSAQNPRVRELTARYDSIWPLLVVAESTYRVQAIAANAAEEAKKAEKLDTVFVGPLTVIARPAFIEEARAYIADSWKDFETSAQGAEGQLRGITIMVEASKPVSMFRQMAHRPRHMLLQLPSLLSLQARRAYGMRAIGTQVTTTAPPAIRTWLMGAPLSSESNDARVYRELAVSRSDAAAKCFRQQVEGCIDALAMVPPDSLWSTWYSAAQLRELTLESTEGGRRGRTSELDACIRLNRVESCASYLRWGHTVPLPLSASARAAFLRYALERGGQGSLARLLNSNADVQSAIEAAARQPIEPLVASWRAEVQKAKPEMHAGVTRSRIAIVFWLLVCAGLAMRSTRWRLA
jgi:hypothetical protein